MAEYVSQVVFISFSTTYLIRAVFRNVVKVRGLEDHFEVIDSFGTGTYHVGEPADRRSVKVCRDNGIEIDHRAQQIWPTHFTKFDYILAMDHSNLEDLQEMAPRNSRAKVQLFGQYRTDKQFSPAVSDPYYGGTRGFETSFHQLSHFSEVFLDQVLNK